MGFDGQRSPQRIRRSTGVPRPADHRDVRRRRFHDAGPCDLLTQVRRKARVLHVIVNNESLDFVKIEQQEAGFVPFGVEFKNPNFARVAEAMGAKGIRVEEPGDVRNAVAEALAYKEGPVVLDVVVDPLALSLPSHVPFHTAKGFTLSMAKQVLSGQMDSVITTIKRNTGLI
jgi:pyruvate dehydrogenase (quinone)